MFVRQPSELFKIYHPRTNRRRSKRKTLRSNKQQTKIKTSGKECFIRNFLQRIKDLERPITLAYNENQLEDICQQIVLQMQPFIRQYQILPSSDTELCIFLCGICQYLLYEPITLYCGHTYCERCIKNESDNTVRGCQRCSPDIIGQIQSPIQLGKKASYSKNILLNEIFEKSTSSQIHRRCMTLYYRGLQEYDIHNNNIAVQYFNSALDICENNHLILNSRSQVYLALNRFDESLLDAENVIKLKPNWPNGYWRKSEVLFEMKRYTSALLSSLLALTFEPDDVIGKQIMARHLYAVLHESPSEDINVSALSSELPLFERQLVHQQQPKHLQLKQESFVKIDETRCVYSSMFWFPVTTPCGHVFCRECLIRSVDNTMAKCPMCKKSLIDFFPMLIQSHVNKTEIIDRMIKTYFPDDFIERREQHQKGSSSLINVTDNNLTTISDVPIFVCVLALPNCICPLHIFEPRYRLMMRRCVETESRSFGMCKYDEVTETFADYGTLLYIRGIMYTEDGRSIVDTIGQRRFRVLSREMKDGYNTAHIKLVRDNFIEEHEYNDLVQLNTATYDKVRHWYDNLDEYRKSLLYYQLQEYPVCDNFTIESVDGPRWHWIMLSIVPIEPLLQYIALASESLRIRLQMLNDAVTFSQQQH
ncbi:unnamed protein product [Didymodactylos carnosus]|uniref:LON peptidase N-terminal domain and RING finger protein 3 n=1 Tax=Didymodactylos carnosus TaxID=1234261 RepID=A0A813TB46_9BILA|nr:unnamed protein product [Didymodactylos carnosus]CAF0805873.1 unnamed protein product [Didymodactylos carnosus]CAF3532070.1 unnamed protein product [Didymodactylos carnosus]CAF3591283.1 unnamed protein product [Didymodactylos carnosus]